MKVAVEFTIELDPDERACFPKHSRLGLKELFAINGEAAVKGFINHQIYKFAKDEAKRWNDLAEDAKP